MFSRLSKGNLITLIISVICSIVCFVLVIWVFPFIFFKEESSQWLLLLSTVVSTIGAAFLVDILWELFAKKRFAESIFEIAKISENIANSGINQVGKDFNKIDWKPDLSRTKNLTAVFTYARTWRNTNREELKKLDSFTVIMPNYNNEVIMLEFDRRFNWKKGKTAELIMEAEKEFEQIGAKIKYTNQSLQASYYLMDTVAVMSFFKHSPEKGAVPYIRAEKDGIIYDYIMEELNHFNKTALKDPEKTVAQEKPAEKEQ